MTPVTTFTDSFRGALRTFTGTDPQAQIFVSSIPNIYQLWSLLRSRASSTWRTFGICQSMLSSSNDEATRQFVLQRVKTFNTAFTTSDVSTVDYFHPSLAGQAKLANATWPAAVTIWQA
jgi:hypothetical protein